ncbi:O-antigen ligase family protein [Paraclostridium sordellii]|uniref:Lipid A core-O-antigen ligase and related enzymes n=1 Tax=Paraclostridium sordellii TaxID=1505 RepID=A0A0C7QMS6_PARSO|nr:O-antigen ligase family protein [Paeniclostridium sordellii]CEN79738.1 Lipid A core-O-antigen ligase and related enzymes [[Clostridium] sordellii] [Paeniclostridium sordellii]CEQ04816.1 Lipid A core-O-antigen ligase and related enzymes [[Clostridium] sordellii] [Paeniclostridium sordellii]
MEDKKNFNIEKVKLYLLILFVISQPLLDTYYLYTDKVVSLIGFSPSTIMRVGITFVLIILTLVTLKDKKKWVFILSYIGIVAVYTILHLVNANNFHSLVPGNFGYSIAGEIFYIIRLMIPLSIVFITYNMDINFDDFTKTIIWLLVLISGTIVITNILKISLNSYTNEVIKANVFEWFMGAYNKYNYSSLASKGVFNFANQIAALLVLLLPIGLAIYTYKKTFLNLISVILTVVAMIMIGTKVALFGAIIEVAMFLCILIFMRIFKKENTLNKKNILMIGLSILCIAGLFMKSPAINREIVSRYVRINNSKVEVEGVDENKEINSVEQTEEKSDNSSKPDLKNTDILDDEDISHLNNKGMDTAKQPDKSNKESMIEYIEKNYHNLRVNEQFITNSYPYKYDPEFWVDIINLPVIERLDWRNLEQKMLQRVMDINDNPMDKLVGITFARTQNIFNLERDFLSQYYSMGILGVIIFLGPYVILPLVCFMMMINKFKEKFNVLNTSLCLSILFTLGVSYYSGNVIDGLTVTIILAFTLGYLVKETFIK